MVKYLRIINRTIGCITIITVLLAYFNIIDESINIRLYLFGILKPYMILTSSMLFEFICLLKVNLDDLRPKMMIDGVDLPDTVQHSNTRKEDVKPIISYMNSDKDSNVYTRTPTPGGNSPRSNVPSDPLENGLLHRGWNYFSKAYNDKHSTDNPSLFPPYPVVTDNPGPVVPTDTPEANSSSSSKNTDIDVPISKDGVSWRDTNVQLRSVPSEPRSAEMDGIISSKITKAMTGDHSKIISMTMTGLSCREMKYIFDHFGHVLSPSATQDSPNGTKITQKVAAAIANVPYRRIR